MPVPYELSCPSCGVVTVSPFVRVGAVVACGRCGHKYRIADGHVKRKVAAAGGGSAGAGGSSSEHLVGDEGEAGTEELVRRAADGHVVGLSGLSEMMRQEPVPTGSRPMPAPPAARPVSSPDRRRGNSARAAKLQARRRNRRVVYAMFGGLGLVMAGIGVALWLAMMSGGIMLKLPPPPRPVDSDIPPRPSAHSDLPLVYAQPMRAKPWQPVGEGYQPPPPDAEAWLVDLATVFSGVDVHFTASIVCTSPQIVTAAAMHIVLADTHGKPIVRTELPVALFGADHRQRIRLAVPPGLRLMPNGTWIEIKDRLRDGIYLTPARIDPLPDEPDNQRLVIVTNPGEHPVEQLVVMITAADSRDRPLARWRIELTQRIEPGATAQIRVLLPNPVDDAARWIVDAAGAAEPPPASPSDLVIPSADGFPTESAPVPPIPADDDAEAAFSAGTLTAESPSLDMATSPDDAATDDVLPDEDPGDDAEAPDPAPPY